MSNTVAIYWNDYNELEARVSFPTGVNVWFGFTDKQEVDELLDLVGLAFPTAIFHPDHGPKYYYGKS